MPKLLPVFAALLALVAWVAPAQAQGYFGQPELRGIGCHWHRGTHHCARYCYREVDGRYYCHRRLREAGSQAPPPMDYYGEPLPPRPPGRR